MSILQKIEARYREGDGVNWGIEDVASGTIVGNAGFYRGFANGNAEVGYKMKEQFRNMGYMSEAVALIVRFGFEHMKLNRIFAHTSPVNVASHTVLMKCGFVHSKTLENGDFEFEISPES